VYGIRIQQLDGKNPDFQYKSQSFTRNKNREERDGRTDLNRLLCSIPFVYAFIFSDSQRLKSTPTEPDCRWIEPSLKIQPISNKRSILVKQHAC
jgi:hypothetical protein